MSTDQAADWTTSKESGSQRQLRLMRWLALRAPAAVTDPLIWAISLIFALQTWRPTTRGSILYLSRILGRDPGLRERHRHARTFAHVFLDRVQLLANGVDSFRIDANGQHLIEELHNSGRGAVLLGAHFGSFEALRAFDRSLPGLRVRYLMFPENAQTSTALMSELNTEVADRVISLADGKRAMMEAGEALRQGDFVAFLGDRLPDRTIRSQISAPFLGESIKLPTSPYIVAMVARVPLILCVAPRLGRAHYAIEFSLLDDGAPVERAARSDHIAVLADRYSATLENLCRRYPYNWFNFFDIWGE